MNPNVKFHIKFGECFLTFLAVTIIILFDLSMLISLIDFVRLGLDVSPWEYVFLISATTWLNCVVSRWGWFRYCYLAAFIYFRYKKIFSKHSINSIDDLFVKGNFNPNSKNKVDKNIRNLVVYGFIPGLSIDRYGVFIYENNTVSTPLSPEPTKIPQEVTPSSVTIDEKLNTLSVLHESGKINDEEFQKAKDKLLD